jgi:hypothetical protein
MSEKFQPPTATVAIDAVSAPDPACEASTGDERAITDHSDDHART